MSLAKLDSVVTYAGTNAVTTTKLEYAKSPTTNRSLLRSIKECAGLSNTCQPPTEFTYTPGSISYTTSTAFTKDKNGLANGLQTKEFKRNVPYSAYSAQDQAAGTIEADFNGDGRTDFLVWSDDPAKHALYLSEGIGNYRLVPNGTGAGKFNVTNYLFLSTNAIVRKGWSTNSLPISSNDVDYCFATEVADVNGDGLPDLVRTRGRGLCAYAEDSYVFISNGDGSFTRQVVRSSGGSPISVYRTTGGSFDDSLKVRNGYAQFFVGDFNRDGKADIVQLVANWAYQKQLTANFVVCESYAPQWCGAVLWAGNGDGSFNAAQLSFAVSPGVQGPPTYDSEVDPTAGPVTAWRADLGRSVTYTHYVPFSSSSEYPVNIRMVDLNGDGSMDLQFSGYASSTYLGSTGSSFSYVGNGNTVGQVPYQGDFNGDGRLDMLGPITNNGIRFIAWGGRGANWETPVLGDGVYGPAVVDIWGSGIVVADVDGDGRSDLLTSTYSGTRVRRSLGNGNFRGLPD